MSVDLPGLIIPVEARITKLEQGLKRAAQVQARSAQTMENRAKLSAKRMTDTYESAGNGMSAAMAKIAAPLAALLVVNTLVNIGKAARRAIGDMSSLAKEADRVAVSTDDFQGLRHGLKLAGVSTDETSKALEQFVDRLGDAKNGTGELSKELARTGISMFDSSGNLRPVIDLLKDYSDAVKRAPDAAARMQMMTSAFGKGGKAMSVAFAQGSDAMDQWIADAKEGGFVIDESILRRAEKLDDKFDMLADRLGNVFKHGVVEAATFFGMVERERAKLEFVPEQVARVIDNDLARQLEQQGDVGQEALRVVQEMKTEYRELGREAQALAMQLADASNMLRGVGQAAQADALMALSQRMADAAGEFERGSISGEAFASTLGDVATEATTTISEMDALDQASLSGVIGQVSNLLSWIQELPAAIQAARAEISQLEAPGMTPGGAPLAGSIEALMPVTAQAPVVSPRPRRAPPMIGEPEKPNTARGGGGGGGRDEWGSAVAAIQAETQALQAEAAALIATAASGNRYGDAIEFARQKAELLVAAQRAGMQITPELTAKIDALAQAHVVAGASAETAANKLQAIQDFGKQSADTMADLFTGIVTGSITAEQALQQLIGQLIQMAAQKFFLKLFAGPLGLGFATGGYTGDGATFQPAGMVHKGEFVLSKKATSRLGVDNLNALHASALRGYSGGGAVGAVPKLNNAFGSDKASSVAQTVTVNAPVTVQGSSGSPEQNEDLARQIATEMQSSLKIFFASELRRQMRPGAMLNNRA